MPSTFGMQSPSDLCNAAFVRIGYKLRVGSLYDGSMAAQKCLDVYAQTRDELLESFDYDFAERTVALTMLKQAPANGYFPPTAWDPATYPPVGFLYEYAFPDDAIKIRIVKQAPLFVMNPDPQPNAFQLANDNAYTPPRRVILCQVPSAVATYTGQVTDPTTWNVSFCEAISAALSRRLGPTLVSAEASKMAASDEQTETAIAQQDGR